MYVAVKGGEAAIDNAHRLLAEERRGNLDIAELSIGQIREQLRLAVDRVMTEGSLYDADLAALAIKQSRGDLLEAIFLLRAYRTTLSRVAESRPIDTSTMQVRRRISATYKDLPGGQVLGPTFDYTHRLLDFALAAEGLERPDAASNTPEHAADGPAISEDMPRVTDLLADEDLIERDEPIDGGFETPGDLTQDPLSFPIARDLRLQALARGDEGFLMAMAYSTQRGYGRTHPFAGEIRMGEVAVEIEVDGLDFPVVIGEITVTECEMINQFKGSKEKPPQFTRGYGLTFGFCERKSMSMALVDRSLRTRDLGEVSDAPANDEEFVISHSDNVEASGFVQHLKLPHYVDFQSELEMVRKMRREIAARHRQDNITMDAADD